MRHCLICRLPIDGPAQFLQRDDGDVHPACLAARLPQDALVALLAAAALTLVAPIVVWAG